MFDWKASLARLFAATVNQEPLENAADLMVSVSARDASYHTECVATLEGGIQACDKGETEVLSAINQSGYKVGTLDEAKELLVEFLEIYEQRYREAMTSK
ncbi:hypothetical protein SAMN05216359_1301 [Roseateles sp. YR242]|uniref:hypothetical protein n=1 Tax=Roseateles sp. YR242 TaxID=1855305 RepID=UPI0008C219A0|nr:hypothetical protein [Roseateles sp. YR242]SEL93818.1 hypothetical protein SAMN05216359_1301 [Roseateles sp. YR242]